ncbi:ATP-dependent helicase [Altererythrobacter aerius]|uniref:ATP-dependent helicase n=1 Tax=Tsuneonella aeria TaxID=1837929 RepID=A0A6I4TC63_9SPHN|nr:ATP-dependent helicase [Tsuneonella aeria]
MSADPVTIGIQYLPGKLSGRLVLEGSPSTSVWERLQQTVINLGFDYSFGPGSIELSWSGVLTLIGQFAPQQKHLDFRFSPRDDDARDKIAAFVQQFKQVQHSKGSLKLRITPEEIEERLFASGFTRELRPFQLRDLQRLLSLENGANFSVPGAGKTTVTLALHLLTRQPNQVLLVIGPKASFPAWREVVSECVREDAPDGNAEPFTFLTTSGEALSEALRSGATRFVLSYDLMIQTSEIITEFMSQHPVHLVLDEAHRMKAGYGSQRGSLLLNLAPLPIRRDILTGTPMPQQPSDIQSQLDFLWPGAGLGLQISRGTAPRQVLGELYVRTTKQDLNLPEPLRHFRSVPMAEGQMALYGIVKHEFLRQVSTLGLDGRFDAPAARRSVMRLLQLSANPVLALRSIADDAIKMDSGILEQVISEGPSTKMRAVADHARQLAAEGKKSVVWTIFTDTIQQMEVMLADLNPVSLYGAVPSGEPTDPETREGRIRRFHEDPSCMVMIANPAAAGEGISLHKVCHDAIYLDRSYVTTHYLQSIDRIHRLGLPPGVETNIYIYRTLAPMGLGCIDHSVSHRLRQKLRALQILLDDADLHRIALDEENSEDPIAWDISPDDVRDLIEVLEGRGSLPDEESE